ncbi:hypothetical protein GCM10010468_79820 [Actinocorallia longicatena]|uniref:Signal transduction histidine kinase subgroup 3 dimerisation and phosphoacceptor domain-containing protein n=1 Tax=Actinocorallia longicatena TaxID=111803 RepID=A0ABP6QNJ6_9ACTN
MAEGFVIGGLIVLGLFGGAGNLIISRPGIDKFAWPYLLWAGCVGLLPLILIFIVLPRFGRLRLRHRRALFALVLVVCFLPVLTPIHLQANTGYALAAVYVLFQGRTRWTWAAALLAATLVIDSTAWPAGAFGKDLCGHVAYWMINNVSIGIQVAVLARFARVTHRLETTRRDVAEISLAEERLRAGRDVHDLLGFSLTVIIVRLEVVLRALRKGDAGEELDLAAGLVDQALADLGTVARGTPPTSLRAEIEAARSVLGRSGVEAEITVTGSPGEIADRELAYVLREAVTNVLRHSAADRCEIVAGPGGLRVSNNGAVPSASPPGSGLRGLRGRLAAHGGTVETGLDDGVFTLTAKIPRPARGGVPARWREFAPLAGLVLALEGLASLDPHFWRGAPAPVIAASLAATVVVYAILFRFAAARPVARPVRLLAVQAVFAVVPCLLGWAPYDQLAALAAGAVWVLPRRAAVAAFTACWLAGTWYTSVVILKTGVWPGSVQGTGLLFLTLNSTLYTQIAYWMTLELSRLARELTRARAGLAAAAVARERARFAHQLGDRLGSGLSAVARSLAVARASPDPEPDLRAAIAQARDTAQEVRSIARAATS